MPKVKMLTPEQGRQFFDWNARRILGISGEEFLLRYDRGDYDDGEDHMRVARLEILIPFARDVPS